MKVLRQRYDWVRGTPGVLFPGHETKSVLEDFFARFKLLSMREHSRFHFCLVKAFGGFPWVLKRIAIGI